MNDLNRGRYHEYNGQCNIEFCDEYEHIDTSIQYVLENILQITNTNTESYHDLYKKFNSFVARKCGCTAATDKKLCTQVSCLHGGNYIIHENEVSKQSELILNKNRRSSDVIYECSEFCVCSPYCANRLVQFGPRKDLKIQDYSQFGKQFGLTTLKLIPNGGFICEYSGEILCKEEATIRSRLNDEQQKMNYIICLNEKPIECEAAGDVIQTFIDPSHVGNIGRYLNHSCDPNCEIISVRIDGMIPKLGIFAKKTIIPNEELCFDYGEDEKNLSTAIHIQNRKPCLCGTSKCRKYLPNLSI